MSVEPLFRQALAAFHSGDLAASRRDALAVLGQAPGHAAAEHLLGLIDCREGKLESGIVHLRRAFGLDPANPGFRMMLARALTDSGQGAEALAMAERPVGALAGHPGLWQARAEAADAVADHESAAEAWSRVAALQPGEWRALSNAGNALARLGRWPEAANALAEAARLNPGELQIRRNFVSALGQSGQFERAVAEVEALLTADPDDGAARMLLAKSLSELGRHQESLDQYDIAVKRCLAGAAGDSGMALLDLARRQSQRTEESQHDPDLVKSIAALLERTNRLAELDSLIAAAQAAGIGPSVLANAAAGSALRRGDAAQARQILIDAEPSDAVYRYRLLAKIEESLGHADAAFEAAEKMNRAVEGYDSWRSKAAAYRARIRAMRRAAETADPIAPLDPSPRRSPAFLVGFPRSGTTLLDTFLMGHPDVAVLEEVHLLGAAETRLGGANRLDRCSRTDLAAARDAYFAELDRHVDPAFGGLVVDKLPLNLLGLPFIHALFPDARVIFAQRHPCDCVLSCFMQSFVLNDAMASFLDLSDAADLYDAALDQFSFTRQRLPLAVADIVYERLIEDPRGALQPLVGFLGLEWHDELLDHQKTARSRGAIITPSYHQIVRPLDKAPSGRWTRYREQLAPVLSVLAPWARRLGYGEI